MFYDKYCELCALKGVSPTRAAIEIGLSKGTPTSWKRANRIPHAAQLQKVADYFGVTVDSLLDKEKAPTAGESSERDEMTGEILEELLKLPPKSQEEARKYIRFLAQQATEENP